MAWLTNWNRRKSITVNGSTAGPQSDYQMLLNVGQGSGTDSAGNVYLGGNVLSNFNDLRFTKSDGSTLLNYWIEFITGTSPSQIARVWIKLAPSPDTIPASGTYSFYIYYNNPSASVGSNGDSTFIFIDDFNGSTYTNKWDLICKINDQLSETGGYLIQGSPPGSLTNGGGCPDGSSPASGSVIKNRVDIGNGVEYHLRVGSATQPDVWQRYGIEFSSTGSMYDKQGVCTCNNNVGNLVGADKYRLMIYPGYGQLNLQRYDSSTVIFDRNMTGYSIANKFVKIQYLSPNLNVYSSTDGLTWGSPLSISATNASIKTGRILFTSYNCCDRTGTIYYDYIFARKLTSPEPTWGTIGTEQSVILNISSSPTGAEILLAHPTGTSYVDQGVTANNTLYVIAGTYDIKLTLGGYTDWTLTNQTYVAGQTANISGTLAPIPGSLSVSSTPSGAEIYLALQPGIPIDQGITTQPAGTTLTGLVPGTYNVLLRLTGYQDWTGTATVTSGIISYLSATFTGSLNMSSTPSGADIFIDGVDQLITTPHIFTGMADGPHTYKLTLAGYSDLTGSFTIAAGSTTPVSPTFLGNLNMSSTPSGASIYLDGSTTSSGTTPATISGLANIGHTYRLILTGYQDVTGSFSITEGQTTPVSTTFPGSLNMTSIPSGASIYIDSILQSGVTTPTIITGLSSGSHAYRITLTGYADSTGTFSITAGQTTNLPVTFLGSLNISSSPSGARIIIDNVDQGVNTPNTVTGLLQGNHNYRLSLSGYADAIGTVSINNALTTFISPSLSTLVTGITNGNFTNDLVRWGQTGPGVSWESSTNRARVDLDRNRLGCVTSTIEQMFIIDSNSLSFVWTIGNVDSPSSDVAEIIEYDFYVDGVLKNTGQMSALRGYNYTQTVTIDTSAYVGRTGRLTLYPVYHSYCFYSAFLTISLWLGNVTTHGNLNISSSPSGASVYIDNSSTSSGVTPLTVTDITGLPHTYKLSLSGYQDITGTVSVTAGATTPVSVTLLPSTGNMSITSTPSGADVWIAPHGGTLTYQGTTPITISNLDPGTYDYKLTRTGYYDTIGTLDISSNTTTPLNVMLTLVLGGITLTSIPTNAEIWLAPTGFPLIDQAVLTTATIGGFTPGVSYTYELRLADYYPRDGTFILVDGEIITRNEILDPVPCPSLPRYSSDTVTLQATPRDGVGPYYVEFRKNGVMIDPSRLDGTNPITNAPENITITRHYILNDLDVSSALMGIINFEVFMSDSCPLGGMTCDQVCTINIGCLAPVCNFVVV